MLTWTEYFFLPCQSFFYLVLGPDLVFRTFALREKAALELQQMDAIHDPALIDLVASDCTYSQKAQLVALIWREIVSIGRATALWALLCLPEIPPADKIQATWLLCTIGLQPRTAALLSCWLIRS